MQSPDYAKHVSKENIFSIYKIQRRVLFVTHLTHEKQKAILACATNLSFGFLREERG